MSSQALTSNLDPSCFGGWGSFVSQNIIGWKSLLVSFCACLILIALRVSLMLYIKGTRAASTPSLFTNTTLSTFFERLCQPENLLLRSCPPVCNSQFLETAWSTCICTLCCLVPAGLHCHSTQHKSVRFWRSIALSIPLPTGTADVCRTAVNHIDLEQDEMAPAHHKVKPFCSQAIKNQSSTEKGMTSRLCFRPAYGLRPASSLILLLILLCACGADVTRLHRPVRTARPLRPMCSCILKQDEFRWVNSYTDKSITGPAGLMESLAHGKGWFFSRGDVTWQMWAKRLESNFSVFQPSISLKQLQWLCLTAEEFIHNDESTTEIASWALTAEIKWLLP